jgi:pimeloyl-ACP methyl ester carboxylesterase
LFSKAAAALGYHVINLYYSNTVTTRICKDKTDSGCFTKFHEEIIFGKSQSSLVNVNASNSIVNRLLKALQYLHKNHPADGWNNYFDVNGLRYSRFALAGHSQGGGHAAYLAYKFPVVRVIAFSSPNDYSEYYKKTASWCHAVFATDINRFYGLMHKRDEIVPPYEQYAVWKDMKMLSAADTSSADNSTYRGYHALFTNYDPDPPATSTKLRHNVPVMDQAIPTGAHGDHLKLVWKYFLGG